MTKPQRSAAKEAAEAAKRFLSFLGRAGLSGAASTADLPLTVLPHFTGKLLPKKYQESLPRPFAIHDRAVKAYDDLTGGRGAPQDKMESYAADIASALTGMGGLKLGAKGVKKALQRAGRSKGMHRAARAEKAFDYTMPNIGAAIGSTAASKYASEDLDQGVLGSLGAGLIGGIAGGVGLPFSTKALPKVGNIALNVARSPCQTFYKEIGKRASIDPQRYDAIKAIHPDIPVSIRDISADPRVAALQTPLEKTLYVHKNIHNLPQEQRGIFEEILKPKGSIKADIFEDKAGKLMLWAGEKARHKHNIRINKLEDKFKNYRDQYLQQTGKPHLTVGVEKPLNYFDQVYKTATSPEEKSAFWKSAQGKMYKKLLNHTAESLEDDEVYRQALKSGSTHSMAESAQKFLELPSLSAKKIFLETPEGLDLIKNLNLEKDLAAASRSGINTDSFRPTLVATLVGDKLRDNPATLKGVSALEPRTREWSLVKDLRDEAYKKAKPAYGQIGQGDPAEFKHIGNLLRDSLNDSLDGLSDSKLGQKMSRAWLLRNRLHHDFAEYDKPLINAMYDKGHMSESLAKKLRNTKASDIDSLKGGERLRGKDVFSQGVNSFVDPTQQDKYISLATKHLPLPEKFELGQNLIARLGQSSPNRAFDPLKLATNYLKLNDESKALIKSTFLNSQEAQRFDFATDIFARLDQLKKGGANTSQTAIVKQLRNDVNGVVEVAETAVKKGLVKAGMGMLKNMVGPLAISWTFTNQKLIDRVVQALKSQSPKEAGQYLSALNKKQINNEIQHWLSTSVLNSVKKAVSPTQNFPKVLNSLQKNKESSEEKEMLSKEIEKLQLKMQIEELEKKMLNSQTEQNID